MSTADKNILVITRQFDAPREKVWEAWTNPNKQKRWWGPEGFTAPFISNDLRVGGKYLNSMKSPEGQEYWSTGIYKEIKKPERIVCTDSFADKKGNKASPTHYGFTSEFPEELIVDVTFEDIGGKTKMTLKHIGMPEENHESTREGWNGSLDKLEAIIK